MAVRSLAQQSLVTPYRGNSALAGYETNMFHHLETIRLGSSAASVEFTNLGQYSDFQHLQIRATPKVTTADNALHIQVNADTGNNYYWHMLYTADGSTVGSYPSGATSSVRATYTPPTTANIFAACVIDILDPFETTKNTTFRSFGGYATPRLGLYSGAWFNTNALTEIKLTAIAGSSLAAGSRFSLYGLKARA